jgi:hypothetical protein
LVLESFTQIFQHISALVKIGQQYWALYMKIYMSFCGRKYLDGESPDYLGYHGYLENPLPAAQPRRETICDNVISQPDPAHSKVIGPTQCRRHRSHSQRSEVKF